VHRDRQAAAIPLGEIVAFEHPGERVARGQLDHAARAERIAPFRVVADLGTGRVEHQAGLLEISTGVRLDLLAGERRPGRVAARGIADHRGEVADQEDHRVPEVLQLTHLVQHDRVAQVQVRRRGVEPELDPQRLPGPLGPDELAKEVLLDQQLVAASLRDGEGPTGGRGRLRLGVVGRHGRSSHRRYSTREAELWAWQVFRIQSHARRRRTAVPSVVLGSKGCRF